jgi:hypothetical protein
MGCGFAINISCKSKNPSAPPTTYLFEMKYPHWQYYRTLIEDLDRISRYVELHPHNFRTFSIELARLYLAAGSEVDVVAKLLCEKAKPSSSCRNINEYRDVLLAAYPGLTSIETSLPRHSLSFTPWESWERENPEWWRSYNDVKHKRDEFYQEACLENVLLALSGLCVFVCYLDYDLIAGGIGTSRPSLFLDSKYNTGGKILISPKIHLLDFPKPSPKSSRQVE